MSAHRTAKIEKQHLRLLEGLAAAIREKGLARTQVGDIVRHARASRRTFYNHFPDKTPASSNSSTSVRPTSLPRSRRRSTSIYRAPRRLTRPSTSIYPYSSVNRPDPGACQPFRW